MPEPRPSPSGMPAGPGKPWRWSWLAAPLAVGLALRLLGADSSLWSDEIYTLQLARLDPATIWSEPDQTPPLYALILHAWTGLAGEQEWVLRLPSLAASLATIALVGALGRLLASNRAAYVAAWLCAVSPLLVIQGHEARAYSLLAALCVAGPVLLLRAAQTGAWRWRLAWSVVAALAVYTHVFAVFFLVGQAVFWWLELRDRIPLRQAAVMAGLAAVAFLPWLPVFLGRIGFVAGGFWIARPSIWMVLVTGAALAGGWAAAALHGGIAVARRPPRLGRWIALVAIPVLVPFAASFVVPMFTPRYVVPAVALACIPLAASLERLPSRIRMGAAAAVLGATLVSVPAVGIVPFPLDFQQDWRGAAAELDGAAGARAVVVWLPGLCDDARPRDLTCPMGVYGHRDDLRHTGYGDPARRPGPEGLPDLAVRLGNATEVWLVQADTAVPDRFLQQWLAGRGALQHEWRGEGVLLQRYVQG